MTAALRVKMVLGEGGILDNASSLSAALLARGEEPGIDEHTHELFERLKVRLMAECTIVSPRRQLSVSLALEDLQAACAERLITATGSHAELVHRLYDFQMRCDHMIEVDKSFVCTLGRIKDMLGARSLSKVGSKEVLLARLVDAVDSSGMQHASADKCDAVIAGPICLAGGRKVVTTDASPDGLVARFTFDDSMGLDNCGKGNHADLGAATLQFGPGIGGRGHAAKLTGANYIEIPNHPAYSEAGASFSLELWIYLRQDSTGDWRTVVHKGSHDEERTPTIFLEPLTRGIEFFVSTTDMAQPLGERVWSNSFIPLHRWTHIAAVVEGHSLRLFVNGLLDAENSTVGTIVQNSGPLRLGGDPWRPAGGFDGYIDEFKLYDRALATDEIQAGASTAFGGVEPSFVELGCMGCALASAHAACRSGYHLCNHRDLYAGGLMVARAMGWATSNSHVWTAEESSAGGGVNSSWGGNAPGVVQVGLGLCCMDTD